MDFFNDPTAYVVGYDDGRGVKIPAKDFVSASSGGGIMWVTVSKDLKESRLASGPSDEPETMADKTYDEILTALGDGMPVAVRYVSSYGCEFLFATSVGYDYVSFISAGTRGVVGDKQYTGTLEIRILSDNSVSVERTRFQFEYTEVTVEWE